MSRPSHLRAAQRLGAPRLRPLIAALCGAGCFASAFAQAPAPTTMPVLAGQATQPVAGAGSVNTNGSTTANPVQNYLQTSGTAVWHFDSFSIGSAGRVTNTALNARDLTVFRVVGSDRSELAGALSANNRLILINRNGIHAYRGATFGGGGSLVASTQELDPDLAADNYAALLADPTYVRFVSDAGVPSGYGGYGGYGDFSDATLDVEEGVTMVAGDGGSIFLVGDRVRNQGTLRANGGGSVGVVAAGTVEMEVGDSGFIRLVSYEALPAEGQGSNLSVRRVALNAGNIEATDGTVVIAQANLYNRNNGGDLAPTPAVLTAGYGTEQSPNGAYNTGTILARGVNGQGSVTVDARGENNAAVNAGTIDVSAANGTAQAGSILMTGHKVLVGGHGDGDGVGAVARLLANGPSGGGNITLDTRNATDSEASALVHTNSASLIEANATAAGNGGNVVLSTDILGDGPVTWRNPSGRVESLGQIRAVGAGGGQGGTLTIAAPQVFIAEREGVAGSTLGAGGLWRLISSNILIGGGSGGGEYFGGYVSASEISRLLNEGTSVRIEARHGDWEGSVFNDGFMYVYGDAAINRNIGTDAVDLTLASTNDLQVAGGASIAASGESRLNVTLHADVDKSEAEPDGRGSLIIGDPSGGTPMLAPLAGRETVQAVVLGPNEVVIDSNGGNLVLTGAGQPPANLSDQGLTNAAGVRITNATLNAGQGSVTITGAGGSTGSEGSSQNGVDIDNAAIAGSSVSIEGTSTSATGVRLNDTDITATSGPITVVGKSEGGGPVGQHMGVDIDQDVVMRTGAGGVKIHGLAVGGGAGSAGLRINSLRILTADSGAAPLITLVGQTMQTSGAGLQVTSGGSGLVVESAASEDSGVSLASTADIVIGASADPEAQSLLLGDVAPQFNTTGRINIRPMSMEINNPAQATSLNDRVIHIGSAEGSGSGFNIDRRWFGLPAAGGTPPSARYVIGSNTHTGRISVQAGALDGAGAVTLQNQGEGTQGIALGGQTGIRQLNLLSGGPITQTGAIDAEVLNLIVGQGANVQLTAAGNRFGTLNVEGAQTPPNVTPGAQPNSVEQDITGFDTATPAFQRFTIAAVTGNGGSPEGGPEREIDRSFEGSDMLNELRTDVYVHGQLSRPQVCTPANTATGGLALGDGGADALALEWVKVRRGPQLTNCAGMRADSSCAAF